MIAKAPAYPFSAELRRRGQLQSVSRAPDANGNRTDAWTTYATVWFGLPAATGREQQRNQTIVEAASFNIKIRYRTDVERSHKLVYGSRTFLINDVDDFNEEHTHLLLTCTEVVANG